MFFIHWRLQGTKIFYHEQISHENIQRWIFSELRYIVNDIIHSLNLVVHTFVIKPGAGRRAPGFLKLILCGLSVCVCVCVRARGYQ